MPLEYTYSFLILLQILPKGHDGESSPACCAPENACHRLRARPAPPPDEVPSRAALLNPPPAPGPCAVRQALCAVRQALCAVRQAPLYGAPGPLCGAPGPLCGAPGPPVRCARPPVRCAETRRSRLAALRRNEICMRGIPVQNKGGTASFASPLFRGGGAFLFVFAHTAPPQSLFAHARSPLPRRKAPAHACRPVKQRIKPPPARMTRRSALYTGTHNTSIHIHTHPYTSTHSNRHTQHIHTHFLF